MFYRFMIKVPVNKEERYRNISGFVPRYNWDEIAFSVSWIRGAGVQVLCFDVPDALRHAIIHSIMSIDISLISDSAWCLNNIIVEEVVAYFDKSVWLWRDVVRDVEKVFPGPILLVGSKDTDPDQNRPITPDQAPDPDYIHMHEIARHIIHSSETLAVAQETLKSMLETYNRVAASPAVERLSSPDLISELEQQISLLKCIHLRSEAMEARLKNEINLVCAISLGAEWSCS